MVVELRARAPLVDMRMITSRGVWTTLITGIAFGVATLTAAHDQHEHPRTPPHQQPHQRKPRWWIFREDPPS
ncbi:hypothetical protein [Nonomuraea sp. NPDC048901]|uniref:hypothetical protein n=1 Tax=Nonomuraea sp. NPDC048901 TaxID=3155627 RepID=UPI0033F214F8